MKEGHNKTSHPLPFLNLKLYRLLPYKQIVFHHILVFDKGCHIAQLTRFIQQYFSPLRIHFTFGGDGHVHTLDRGDGFTGICQCQNLSNKKFTKL